jgi:hypothetical protein
MELGQIQILNAYRYSPIGHYNTLEGVLKGFLNHNGSEVNSMQKRPNKILRSINNYFHVLKQSVRE